MGTQKPMNPIYWSILRHNAGRYRRSTFFMLTLLILGVWLFAGIIFLVSFAPASLFGALAFSLFILATFSAYFWQMGWSAGSVDALTSLQKPKHERDRLFIAFMSTLPLSRWTHFLLQTLLYVAISAGVCLISALVYLLHPFFNGFPLLVLYSHLVLFCALLLLGALQTVTAVPFALRGPLKTMKNPLVIRSIVVTSLFMLLLFSKDRIITFIGENTFADFVLWFASHPSVLGLGFIASACLFYVGGVLFNRADVR